MNNDKEVESLRHKVDEKDERIDKLERENGRLRRERNACQQGVRLLRIDYEKLVDNGPLDKDEFKQIADELLNEMKELEQKLFNPISNDEKSGQDEC